MEQHLNLARMAQAAEPNTPQTATDTPADPGAIAPLLAPSRPSHRAN
jgi:hypothetical protein